MFCRLKDKLIPASVFLILSCQLLSGCSGSNEVLQGEPEATFAKIVAEEVYQMDDTGTDEDVVVTDMVDDTGSMVGKVLAQIPDKGIYLYGEENGVTLQVGEKEHYYEWLYMTPRGIEPRMSLADYDGDGKDELSIILYIGSGTGVSVEELHIIEIYDEQGSFNDNVFGYESYIEQMDKAIGYKMFTSEGRLMAEISTPVEAYTVSLEAFDNEDFGKIDEDLCYGLIVSFSEEKGKLSAEFGVGITSEFVVSPCYFGSVFGDVDYEDGVFKLKNLRFKDLKDRQ